MFTILIVDDEYVERDGLRFLIQEAKLPLDVHEAENGEVALAFLEQNQVDILLTDIRMPFMDGLQLAEHARRMCPDLPILLYTSYSEFDYAMRAIQIQVFGYILKPVRRDKLIGGLEKAIDACIQSRADSAYEAGYQGIERMLIALMHGIEPDRKEINAMRAMGIAPNKPIALYMMQFPEPFFPQLHDRFIQFFSQWEEGPSFCWVLNEYVAVVLLFETPVSHDAMMRRGALFRDRITENFSRTPALLYSVSPEGIKGLSAIYHKMDELTDNRLLDRGGVHGMEALLRAGDPGRLHDAEAMLGEALDSVQKGDMKRAYTQTLEFAVIVEELKNTPSAYVKYLCMRVAQGLADAQQDAAPGIDKVGIVDEMFSARDAYALSEILRNMLRKFCPDGTDEEPLSVVSEIRNYIHAHIDGELNLEAIAASVYLTPAYVSFLFKRETGISLIKYITQYRINLARKLLKDTGMRVTDIAAQVGYDNPSYFTVLFRTHTGKTPLQYRSDVQKAVQ